MGNKKTKKLLPPRKSIIFCKADVQSLLDGCKNQLRIPVKLIGFNSFSGSPYSDWSFRTKRGTWNDLPTDELISRYCPYQVDDVVLVREDIWYAAVDCRRVRSMNRDMINFLFYETTREFSGIKYKKMAARRVPDWVCRFELIIRSVGVERLSDISHDDALGEGIRCVGDTNFYDPGGVAWNHLFHSTPQLAYMRMWDRLYEKDNFPSQMNPYVFRIGFIFRDTENG